MALAPQRIAKEAPRCVRGTGRGSLVNLVIASQQGEQIR